jgi:hypothetical protein
VDKGWAFTVGPVDDGAILHLLSAGSSPDGEALGADYAEDLSARLTTVTGGLVTAGAPTRAATEGALAGVDAQTWRVTLPAQLVGVFDVEETGEIRHASVAGRDVVLQCKSRTADWGDVSSGCELIASTLRIGDVGGAVADSSTPAVAPVGRQGAAAQASFVDELIGQAVPLLLSVFWLVGGSLLLASRRFAVSWVEGPKGWLWRKTLGVDRSVPVIRFGCGPLMMLSGAGTLVGLALTLLS